MLLTILLLVMFFILLIRTVFYVPKVDNKPIVKYYKIKKYNNMENTINNETEEKVEMEITPIEEQEVYEDYSIIDDENKTQQQILKESKITYFDIYKTLVNKRKNRFKQF